MSRLPRFILSDLERERALRGIDFQEKGSAYYAMQHLTRKYSSTTRSSTSRVLTERAARTPAYGLNDSPIGTLAWIGEKVCLARV